MPIGFYLQAWRVLKGHSVAAVAAKVGMDVGSLENIEAGHLDPTLSTMEAVASFLGVPTSWLHGDPKHLDLLISDADGDESDPPSLKSPDPVLEHILFASHQNRDLYVLLTKLVYSGDPKLIRAAEVSLRSLVKQAKQATVPWQNRQPGHFEPPSD